MKIHHGGIVMPQPLISVKEEFTARIEEIESGSGDGLSKLRNCIHAATLAVKKIREYIAEHLLESIQEEIDFFKNIKPWFYSRYLFYVKIYQIEVLRPTGAVEDEMEYISKEMKILTGYFEANKAFYEYLRTKSDFLDDRYFVRGGAMADNVMDPYFLDADPKFCTTHDFKVARIIANEQIAEYLKSLLNELKPGNGQYVNNAAPGDLVWTASKASLIELIYALQSAGAFNSGEADIRQIADLLQKTFNVNLGNLYRTFQEIRIRKKGRTFFLDSLKEQLIKRMDFTDENPRI